MKKLFLSLLLCTFTLSLSASRLNHKKPVADLTAEEKLIFEALFKSQLGVTKKQFTWELVDDQNLITAGLTPDPQKRVYHLILNKLPRNTRFNIYALPLMDLKHSYLFASGYTNKKGEAIIHYDEEKDVALSSIYLQAIADFPGEPLYHLLMTKDKKTYLATGIVPIPIEAFGKEGRHVWMEMIFPFEEAYFIRGENFAPGEKIHLRPDVTNPFQIDLTASKKGNFSYLLRANEEKIPILQERELEIVSSESSELMKIKYIRGYLKEEQ